LRVVAMYAIGVAVEGGETRLVKRPNADGLTICGPRPFAGQSPVNIVGKFASRVGGSRLGEEKSDFSARDQGDRVRS